MVPRSGSSTCRDAQGGRYYGREIGTDGAFRVPRGIVESFSVRKDDKEEQGKMGVFTVNVK